LKKARRFFEKGRKKTIGGEPVAWAGEGVKKGELPQGNTLENA